MARASLPRGAASRAYQYMPVWKMGWCGSNPNFASSSTFWTTTSRFGPPDDRARLEAGNSVVHPEFKGRRESTSSSFSHFTLPRAAFRAVSGRSANNKSSSKLSGSGRKTGAGRMSVAYERAAVLRPPVNTMSNDTAASPSAASPSVLPAAAAAPSPGHGAHAAPPPAFTSYQKFVVGMLAFLQFTIILDFMIISPLGAILLRDLHLPRSSSAWSSRCTPSAPAPPACWPPGSPTASTARSCCCSSMPASCAARCLCGLAPTYQLLLAARIVTGIFGGVIGSIRWPSSPTCFRSTCAAG